MSTALLVIDVQAGLFAKKTPILHAEALLANIEALVARARRDGVPVFYVQHTGVGLVQGSEGWQLHRRLQPAAGERIIGKCHPSALKDTPLCDELQRHSNFSPKAAEIIAEANEKLAAAGASVLPAAEVRLGV